MIINLKELSNVISQISDLVGSDKNIPGIMFRVGDDIEVCYSGGNGKAMSKHINAQFSENDIKTDIAFNYQNLLRIVEACKPTGKIISDEIEFIFMENNTVKVRCEKKIPIQDGEETINQTMSVVEQLISWTDPSASIKTRALSSEPYGIMYHYPSDDIDSIMAKIYPNIKEENRDKAVKPLTNKEWMEQADKWSISELKSLLNRLSIESGKLVYAAPTSKTAFVQTTSSVICSPVKSDFKNRIIQTSTSAKAIASILSKLNTDDDTIYCHILNNDTLVFSDEANTFAVSVKNMKPDGPTVTQVNNCLSKDFSQYMINFNREVLQSCLYSAKTAGASEKVEISFQKNDNDELKLVINVKNNNSSTNNSYDVLADYFIDDTDTLVGLKLNVTLDVLYQAVSRAETDYIALDIHIEENSNKMLRVSEIDLEKRAEVSKDNGIEGGWTTEFTREHRSDILGYTTYFAVSTN